ncbi:MAG: quercetin 2,3-dioxygenase [Alphaproteobacteria bacterium]|nr:MAG: quercetin 2,3-dioxygenase [Alphaproteobacteria bacterium]
MTHHYDTLTRGKFRNSWLNSHHTFSFGEFHDPKRMSFRSLRVINEDCVAPAGGFAPHGHRDMEIITYVLEGKLAHKDSIGNGSVIRPGEIQRMSAGTGIRHSEMNASDDAQVHFLQIWIEPNKKGHAPSYEQIELPADTGKNGFTPIATPQGSPRAISLNQDAIISVSKPDAGESVDVMLDTDRYGFLHVVKGDVKIDGKTYHAGDGLSFESSETPFALTAKTLSEILFFNLA